MFILEFEMINVNVSHRLWIDIQATRTLVFSVTMVLLNFEIQPGCMFILEFNTGQCVLKK